MYEVIPITWRNEFFYEIQSIYAALKDQERKMFDLTFYEDEATVLAFMEKLITQNDVYVVRENEQILACFIIQDPVCYKGIIIEAKVHCAVRRPYWGAKAREICKVFLDYINDKFRIKKLIAEVPQCGYGVIKLLKDLGFKHEGTLKENLLYKDKNNNNKWYDKLIYSITRKDL